MNGPPLQDPQPRQQILQEPPPLSPLYPSDLSYPLLPPTHPLQLLQLLVPPPQLLPYLTLVTSEGLIMLI